MDSLTPETLALSPDDFKTLWFLTAQLVCQVPVPTVLYLIAAAVARFLGDRHMWGPYLALAAAALFGLH
jgi:ribose/xylose/arabinose/galactoside ABC-type transport system permease subunit